MTTHTQFLSQAQAPSPPAWPIVGSRGGLRAAQNMVRYAEELWRSYGDVVRFKLMGTSMVLITHPDHLQRVLVTERTNFVKGRAYASTRRLMGDSLVTLEGSAWRERRTLAQPAFHRQALEALCAVVVESGATFFGKWLDRMGQDGLEIDAHQEMTHLTLEVVIDALFGKDLIDTAADVPFSSFTSALELISDNFNGLPLPEWLPTPKNLKFKRTLAALDATIYKVIEAGRKRAVGGGSLLSMLLDARDEHGQALPMKALRDEVFTLFLAGHETTALTLAWLFVLLDGRVDVLRRIEEEVAMVLDGRDPSFADVPKLVYLRQVVDETLRLRPPAAMVARDVWEDTEFAGYPVQAGELVLPFFWGVHRHRDFWENPEHFDPDRFAPKSIKSRHPWVYLPFSAGPRICIGNAFSLMESVVLIAQLLNRFEIVVRSCAEVEPHAVGTVRPSRPVRVHVARRRAPLRRSIVTPNDEAVPESQSEH